MRTRTMLAGAMLAGGLLISGLAVPGPARSGHAADAGLAGKVAALVGKDEARLFETFKHLHANPELGFQEVKTAALVAREFKALGYETHAGIGKTGVVGVL